MAIEIESLRNRVAELEFGHDAMTQECKDWQERLAAVEKERDQWRDAEDATTGRLEECQHYAQQLHDAFESLWAGTERSEWDAKAAEHFDKMMLSEPDTSALDALMKDAKNPDCKTCDNRGRIDGSSQETHCEHCLYQEHWRTNHYAEIDEAMK
jgi:chromosome segregation ATPase